MSTQAVLQAKELWAGYGGADVLRGVDLELVPGAAPIGVVGESGAGKSTLIRALVGQVRPSRGHATYRGRSSARLSRRDKKLFRADVRSVSQDGLVVNDPRVTVERTLKGALADARKAGRAHATSIPQLLDFVALEERYALRAVRTLSGGERQRVALASALATRPEILLLDEPLTAIDPQARGEIVRRLAGVVSSLDMGVLLVSHDLEVVERLTSHVHVLADGEFVASGQLADVLARGEHQVVRDLAEAAPLALQRFR
ncbi:ABC transporter related [Beutenbergia cavernae DSM 12333]|uniref:ABC transporter related n=1 Tax=Beutenbergia cavernae (strain ATCC BAA-8 / DSM 12333 / CCUG 43141 / JCM 11478 / NBRC 16432 / NCIMB 13614 / HKI 0122) TaxID=471853 RepID=C5BYT7_BEUC1|nr:ABC transporter ATP-binding protein [Beutenbergia cavernae]ACQ79045.1 ABC transporter related [Beutenbergia cavernae DSM 12333]